MASTPEQFLQTGQNALTLFAQSAKLLEEWSAAFEQRGGAGIYGQEALDIVSFVANPLKTWLDADAARRNTISKQRTDF